MTDEPATEATILAARCDRYGPPSVVTVERVAAPVAAAGEAVVRVHAAAVNFPDVLVIANAYQVSAELPFTPGSEFAGTVVAVAPDVEADPDGLRPGDDVFGIVFIGAFAEEVAVATAALTKVPRGIDPLVLAGFGVAHTTAYHALRTIAAVQPGEWVVVLGAGGGVGLAAVELATVLGARVIAAASTEAKREVARQKGADETIDSGDDIRNDVKRLTGAGADVVIDPVGGPLSERALRGLRWGGRFVSVGFASGEIPRIPLNLVLLKGLVVRGFEFTGLGANLPDEAARDRREVLDLLVAGRVEPHRCAVLPLPDAAEALAWAADRRAIGKVVLDLRQAAV